jgi:hypothetical protein
VYLRGWGIRQFPRHPVNRLHAVDPRFVHGRYVSCGHRRLWFNVSNVLAEWKARQCPFFVISHLVLDNAVFWIFKFLICYSYAKARRQLKIQLNNFSVENAQCHEEIDRLYVEGEIKKFYGNTTAFDELVKGEFLKVVRLKIGPELQAVPYKACLFENAVAFWWILFDSILTLPLEKDSLEKAARVVVFAIGEHFVFNPLYIFILNVLSIVLAHNPHWPRKFTVPLRIIAVPLFGFWWPLWMVCALNPSWPVTLTLLGVGGFAVFSVYRPRNLKKVRGNTFRLQPKDANAEEAVQKIIRNSTREFRDSVTAQDCGNAEDLGKTDCSATVPFDIDKLNEEYEVQQPRLQPRARLQQSLGMRERESGAEEALPLGRQRT